VTRVLAIADTDSYLKWSAATLAAMPADWTCEQLVLENPVMPSPAQVRAATQRPVQVIRRGDVRRRVREDRPDVLLLAGTGPVVIDLANDFRSRDRPVLLTGLPGISVPATASAVRFRAGCDLFVLHSHREVAEFAALAATLAPGLAFGLAPLPFLSADPVISTGTDLVFAAQAKVPIERADREQIVRALAAAGSAVIKVRALADEQQTHREDWPYPDLLDHLVAHGQVERDAVGCAAGPMSVALASARGLATVSSTAALEAMASRLPVLIISDFGVSSEMINLVFADSGCLGTLDDLRHDRLNHPDPVWLAANYFHPAADNTWLGQLTTLLDQRAAGGLPVRPKISSRRSGLRRRLRLLVPPTVVRRVLRARAQLRSWRISAGDRRPGRTAPGPHPGHPAGSAEADPGPGSLAEHQPRPPANQRGSSPRHH
jgi:hypothetical protein